jgi:hypothetical protein
MRVAVGLLTVVCIGALSQALAMEPPASPALSAPQATPESVPSSQSDRTPGGPQSGVKAPVDAAAGTSIAATSAADGTHVKLTTTDPEAEAQLKRLRAAGYKPEVHNGEILFCRKETVVGSRFDQKICNTSDQLENIANTAREQAVKAQRNVSSKLVPN